MSSVFIACTTMSVNIFFYISLQVHKEDINSFSFRRRLPVHSCQMSVCWIGEEGKKMIPLNYKITLKGAKDRYNFLTLTLDYLQLGIGIYCDTLASFPGLPPHARNVTRNKNC